MVVDLAWLADLIKREVESRFDHKNLNLDTEEFRNLNPTAENICVVIFNILRRHIPEKYDLHVRLYETPRNFVEYPA
jgi:6-pyruvoyltetrahydropterin/6-carboxytetrahydropterin synthase